MTRQFTRAAGNLPVYTLNHQPVPHDAGMYILELELKIERHKRRMEQVSNDILWACAAITRADDTLLNDAPACKEWARAWLERAVVRLALGDSMEDVKQFLARDRADIDGEVAEAHHEAEAAHAEWQNQRIEEYR